MLERLRVAARDEQVEVHPEVRQAGRRGVVDPLRLGHGAPVVVAGEGAGTGMWSQHEPEPHAAADDGEPEVVLLGVVEHQQRVEEEPLRVERSSRSSPASRRSARAPRPRRRARPGRRRRKSHGSRRWPSWRSSWRARSPAAPWPGRGCRAATSARCMCSSASSFSPAAEQRLAHLALQRGALDRIPALAEDAGVGGEGLPVVGERLRVGGELGRLVAGLEEVLLGPLPVLGLRVVVGEQRVELVEALREQRLDRSRATGRAARGGGAAGCSRRRRRGSARA